MRQVRHSDCPVPGTGATHWQHVPGSNPTRLHDLLLLLLLVSPAGDLSTNNWLVAILAWGEGWHNNHHALAASAAHGLEWWEVDLTYGVIKLLEALGLAWDIELPTEKQMAAKRKQPAPVQDTVSEANQGSQEKKADLVAKLVISGGKGKSL